MLNESIGKPKELWKALKALVLANKILLMQKKYIKINKTAQHDINFVILTKF